ncbi:MAG TPA: HEAT repeat domain-containing protein [Bacteriovoracaceae bacterium]|nr:HEAT repeat domain-containing protein [Bacteriovoracaceae bacterium]
MSDSPSNNAPAKKMLESSPMSGIAVPIAIVLIGALIIFGVTKMLSSGKNHRDLIDEMNSKTFGNRWVAAYELSKFLAASKIPKEDMPWVIENLSKVYVESVDARTRNFVVLAVGSLNNPLALPVLNKALEDQDSQVKFNAVVSLGRMARNSEIKWTIVEAMLQQETDLGLKQVAILTMAAHARPNTEEKALPLLNQSDRTVRYAAATALIQFQNKAAMPTLEEILNLKYDVAKAGELNGAQVEGLKTNVLENIEKSKWKELASLVEKVEAQDTNIRVATKAKQVLKLLKN